MIREQRKKKRRRKIGLTAALILLMLLAIAFLIVWKVFTVENVVVEGNELYSSEQIEQLVLNDEYSWNSLYVLLKYRIRDTGKVPFVDTMEVTLDDPHTVHVLVYEKGILGCFYIDAIGQYAYFDKDGFVVETSSDEIEDVPKITGVTCDEVVLYEKLPLDQPDVLNNLLSLTQILKKYRPSAAGDSLRQQLKTDADLLRHTGFDRFGRLSVAEDCASVGDPSTACGNVRNTSSGHMDTGHHRYCV